jgi:hypothetical protein
MSVVRTASRLRPRCVSHSLLVVCVYLLGKAKGENQK